MPIGNEAFPFACAFMVAVPAGLAKVEPAQFRTFLIQKRVKALFVREPARACRACVGSRLNIPVGHHFVISTTALAVAFPYYYRVRSLCNLNDSRFLLILIPRFGTTCELTMKKKKNEATEAQLLDLLRKVLPKATHDPELAGKIYSLVESELKAKAQTSAFDKFCARIPLQDLEPESIEQAKRQFVESFPDADVAVKPNKKEKTLAVEIALPNGTQLTGEVQVNAEEAKPEDEEQEIKLKFVPFPVCMPGDKELVWFLAKRENMTSDEAGIALSKAEEDFWGSKTGQKLMRDRVERIFPEFIARVPSGLLNELGLKRHYKTPEAIKVTRSLPPSKEKRTKDSAA
jgi:hypothetical protein